MIKHIQVDSYKFPREYKMLHLTKNPYYKKPTFDTDTTDWRTF